MIGQSRSPVDSSSVWPGVPSHIAQTCQQSWYQPATYSAYPPWSGVPLYDYSHMYHWHNYQSHPTLPPAGTTETLASPPLALVKQERCDDVQSPVSVPTTDSATIDTTDSHVKYNQFTSSSDKLSINTGDRRVRKRPLESGKPPYSYIALICMAIANSTDNCATLRDIIDYIEGRFPYFQGNKKWHGSIRHNLTLNDCFKKLPRRPGDKGCPWTIEQDYEDMFDSGSLLRRRYRYKEGSAKWQKARQQQASRSHKDYLLKKTNKHTQHVPVVTVHSSVAASTKQYHISYTPSLQTLRDTVTSPGSLYTRSPPVDPDVRDGVQNHSAIDCDFPSDLHIDDSVPSPSSSDLPQVQSPISSVSDSVLQHSSQINTSIPVPELTTKSNVPSSPVHGLPDQSSGVLPSCTATMLTTRLGGAMSQMVPGSSPYIPPSAKVSNMPSYTHPRTVPHPYTFYQSVNQDYSTNNMFF